MCHPPRTKKTRRAAIAVEKKISTAKRTLNDVKQADAKQTLIARSVAKKSPKAQNLVHVTLHARTLQDFFCNNGGFRNVAKLSTFPGLHGKINSTMTDFLGQCKLHTETCPEDVYVIELDTLHNIVQEEYSYERSDEKLQGFRMTFPRKMYITFKAQKSLGIVIRISPRFR